MNLVFHADRFLSITSNIFGSQENAIMRKISGYKQNREYDGNRATNALAVSMNGRIKRPFFY
jgi:hypothetical protein